MDEIKNKTENKVKASPLLYATRFICLPADLLSKKDFRLLKSGQAVKISGEKLKKYPEYFEVSDGNS